MSSCDQFREMYEAYALDALDATERAALDAHLATGCAECAKAVAEARWLVSQLAYTAPDAGPSDMLKGRLMQTVRAEARSASTARSATPGVPYWLSAGIAALLLITFYFAWTAYRAKEDLRAANERVTALTQEQHAAAQREVAAMEEQLAAVRRENAILTDPSAVKIMLMPQKIQAPELVAMCGKRGVVLTGQKSSYAFSKPRSAAVVHSQNAGCEAHAFHESAPRLQRPLVDGGGSPARECRRDQSPGHYGRARRWQPAAHQRDSLDGSDELAARFAHRFVHRAKSGRTYFRKSSSVGRFRKREVAASTAWLDSRDCEKFVAALAGSTPTRVFSWVLRFTLS